MVDVSTHPDLASLVDDAATRLTELLATIHSNPAGGVNGDGDARVVVTGGTAGVELLRALRERSIDWSRVHVFFGDERNVPVSDSDSNEGQARAALLSHIPIPVDHVHGYALTGGEMEAAVERYGDTLGRLAPRGFDLHLLGVGEEGHINSLFPHSPALAERERLVVSVSDSPKPPAERVTLTLPALERSERVWFLVSGEEKARAAGQIARGGDPAQWPAAAARGRRETVLFITDDAAGELR